MRKKIITLNENASDVVLNLDEPAQNLAEEENENSQNMLTAKSMEELLENLDREHSAKAEHGAYR